MLVKVKSSGEVVKAKRFKNMTDEEKEITCIENECEGEDIFIKPEDGCYVWEYMLDHEVEIIEEED